jgi:dipeptidyl aminopeptidase/acylaminoacyl peptidase
VVLDAAGRVARFSATDAAAATVRVGEPTFVGGTLHWTTTLPASDGASWLVTAGADRRPRRVSPPEVSVRSSLYDYGAGSWCPTTEGLVGIDARSGAVGWLDRGAFEPLQALGATRLGDLAAMPGHPIVVAVHEHLEPWRATLVALHLHTGVLDVLVDGAELYAEPTVSPDGRRLAWVAWPRGSMPWDAGAVWTAELDVVGGTVVLARPRRVDGGAGCSAGSPTWRADGSLAYVSEAAGWWQPYVCDDGGVVRRLTGRHGEFQRPRWLTCRWLAPIEGDSLACAFADADGEHVGVLAPDGDLWVLDQPCVRVDGLAADGARAGWVGATVEAQGAVVATDELGASAATWRWEVDPPSARTAPPRPERFRVAHDGVELDGVLWRPVTEDPDEATDVLGLVVSIHPGPTGATDHSYAPLTHLLCSHGLAVASLDFSGSTAHGRTHRQRLNGRFGVLDVDECVAAATELVERGTAPLDALFLRGTSSGGTTALLALGAGVLRGAVAWYPASSFDDDADAMEAGYLATLLGEGGARRSPLARADELRGDVLLVQGSDDPIVPLAATEALADSLRDAGLDVELVVLEGEGHGLRSPAARTEALTAELDFYLRRVITQSATSARYDAASSDSTSTPPRP